LRMVRPATVVKSLGQHTKRRMVSGLLVVLPLGATYLIIKFLFDLIDPPLRDVVDGVFGRQIPGVGIFSFFIIIYIAGMVGSYVFGRRVIAVGHSLVNLIPIIRPIYRTVRQTVDALSMTDWEQKFSRVVLLDFPKEGVKSIGFVTASYKDQRGESMVAVYIPTSPVPTSGFLALVPDYTVISISMSVEEAMKVIISGGVLTPAEIQENSRSGEGLQAPGEEDSKDASNH